MQYKSGVWRRRRNKRAGCIVTRTQVANEVESVEGAPVGTFETSLELRNVNIEILGGDR